jgi:hypothetical protein
LLSSLSRYEARFVLFTLPLLLLFDGNTFAYATYNSRKGGGPYFKDLNCPLQVSVHHAYFAFGGETSGLAEVDNFSLHAYIGVEKWVLIRWPGVGIP